MLHDYNKRAIIEEGYTKWEWEHKKKKKKFAKLQESNVFCSFQQSFSINISCTCIVSYPNLFLSLIKSVCKRNTHSIEKESHLTKNGEASTIKRWLDSDPKEMRWTGGIWEQIYSWKYFNAL